MLYPSKYKSYNKSDDYLKYSYYRVIKQPFGHIFESELNFPIDRVLVYMKENKLQFSYFHLGNTYGVFPEILSGYTVNEVLKYFMISEQPIPRNSRIFSNKIASDSSIKHLILSDFSDSIFVSQTKALLYSKGWKSSKIFKSPNSGTIEIISRKL